MYVRQILSLAGEILLWKYDAGIIKMKQKFLGFEELTVCSNFLNRKRQ